jgi:anti-anti-sigma regulatory factor
VEIHHVEGIAVVRAIACENDDNQLSEPWAQELLEASDQLDPPVLVLDFSDVALMRPRAMAQLVLAAVSAPLADLIQITGFGREMHVAASCDEAIVHLSSCGSESEDA